MSPLDDTDSHEIVGATGEYDVEAMSSAIEDPSLGKGAGAEIQELRMDLVYRADALADAASWTRTQFLEHAGCSSEKKLQSLDMGFLLTCQAYLKWVGNMVWALDLAVDRRTAVIAAAELWREGGRSLKLCREVIGGEGLPATRLLRLGEVTYAFQIARAHFETPLGRRTRRVLLDASDDAASPHVSSERVALAWGDPRALGEHITDEVREHLDGCEICKAIHGEFAHAYRASGAR
jgi:hypothetical protein